MNIGDLLYSDSIKLDDTVQYGDEHIGYIITITFTNVSEDNKFLQKYIQCYSEYPVKNDDDFILKLSVKYEDLLNAGWEFNIIEFGPVCFYRIPELEYFQYEQGINYIN